MNWSERYFVRDFDASKKVSDSDIEELCSIVNHIPSQVLNKDHYWLLLNNDNPKHKEIVKWLVKNIYYDPKHDDFVENFGQLMDAPYVMHSLLRRDGEWQGPREEEYHFQRGNVLFHAGAIMSKAVSLGLDTCVIACTEGTNHRDFDELMSEYTALVVDSFPRIERWEDDDQVFPSISMGIGYGIKHNQPVLIEKYGYKWMSYKDNHKAHNMIRN